MSGWSFHLTTLFSGQAWLSGWTVLYAHTFACNSQQPFFESAEGRGGRRNYLRSISTKVWVRTGIKLYPWNCSQAGICSQTCYRLRYAPAYCPQCWRGEILPKMNWTWSDQAIGISQCPSGLIHHQQLLQMTTPPIPHSQFQPNITGMCFLDDPLQK